MAVRSGLSATVLLLALLVAPALGLRPGGPAAYRVSAETFWISIVINQHHAGFGRGVFSKGSAAAYSYENIIFLSSGRFLQAEHSWWDFGANLKPATFLHKTAHYRGGQSLVNTASGTFHYNTGKLECEYNEQNSQEKVEVAIPRDVTSRFVQQLFLAHTALRSGESYRFHVFSVPSRRFVEQTYTAEAYDSSLKAWKLRYTSEEAPGANYLWFQTASASHPNGWVPLNVMAGPNNNNIEARPATREQAIEGYEQYAAALKI